MKKLVLGLSIFVIVCIGIIYCYEYDNSLSFPYRVVYNSQLSINNHSFIVYGNVIRNNYSSYSMDSTVLSTDMLSHILFSLTWSSTWSSLSIPVYVVPTLSYTSKKLGELIDIVATTWIVIPLQDWRRLSEMNYETIEDYGGYRRWVFTWLLPESLPGTTTKIPYEGGYNLYCVPSILAFFSQRHCNITIKTNINIDPKPIIITSDIDFMIYSMK